MIKPSHVISSVLLSISLTTCFSCFAESSCSEKANEIEALKQSQTAILKELQEIKELLRVQRVPTQMKPTFSPRNVEFEFTNNLIKGNQNAKLVLVNIMDYQCPYCSRYTLDTYPQIVKNYVDTGKIRYTVLDNPLPSHPLAPKAAEAARCAKDQGKYWELHTQMMSDQKSISNLLSFTDKLGLDSKAFQNCLDTNKYANDIKKDASVVSKLGISAVPGFIIASIDPTNPSKFKGISSIQGAMPFSVFQQELDRALANLPK
jgi:protein-disulfide isomerase